MRGAQPVAARSFDASPTLTGTSAGRMRAGLRESRPEPARSRSGAAAPRASSSRPRCRRCRSRRPRRRLRAAATYASQTSRTSRKSRLASRLPTSMTRRRPPRRAPAARANADHGEALVLSRTDVVERARRRRRRRRTSARTQARALRRRLCSRRTGCAAAARASRAADTSPRGCAPYTSALLTTSTRAAPPSGRERARGVEHVQRPARVDGERAGRDRRATSGTNACAARCATASGRASSNAAAHRERIGDVERRARRRRRGARGRPRRRRARARASAAIRCAPTNPRAPVTRTRTSARRERPQALEVGAHHQLDELLERDLGLPAEHAPRLGRDRRPADRPPPDGRSAGRRRRSVPSRDRPRRTRAARTRAPHACARSRSRSRRHAPAAASATSRARSRRRIPSRAARRGSPAAARSASPA